MPTFLRDWLGVIVIVISLIGGAISVITKVSTLISTVDRLNTALAAADQKFDDYVRDQNQIRMQTVAWQAVVDERLRRR